MNILKPSSDFSLKGGPCILLLCTLSIKEKKKKKALDPPSTLAECLQSHIEVKYKSSHSKSLWMASGARPA